MGVVDPTLEQDRVNNTHETSTTDDVQVLDSQANEQKGPGLDPPRTTLSYHQSGWEQDGWGQLVRNSTYSPVMMEAAGWVFFLFSVDHLFGPHVGPHRRTKLVG